MAVIELLPRLYFIRFPVAPADLWHDPDGLTLIDTGLPGAASLIAEAIRHGGQPADLRRLVLTHFHADHIGAAAEVAGWGEVEVFAHHVVGPARMAAYRSHLRNHILPRFGHVPLTQINRHQIKLFVKDLKTRLADSSVTSIIALLSMLLREAVADRRIGHNPCHNIRVTTSRPPERPHATPAEVNTIAGRISRFDEQALVITAAYTGMRWGELTGLARANTHLGDGLIRIDAGIGALHELAGKLVLGPPKTVDSARDVHLPPFLIALNQVLDGHDHEQVFAGAYGGYLRRSNFNRRTWTPAVGGDPDGGIPPVIAGMHFHDLRHTHKTWLIEDDIPEIAQAKRLGHRLPGIRGVYSHVTPAMQQRITDALQARWTAHRPRRLHAVDDPPRAA